MAKDDLYEILGVSRGAGDAEIKKAYRKLARELHPDRNKNNKQSEERFKKVAAAYAVLGNKEKRNLYDQYGVDGLRDGFDPEKWRQYGGGFQGERSRSGRGRQPTDFDFGGFSGFGSLEDIFESLFGGTPEGRAAGKAHARSWGFGQQEIQQGQGIRSTLEVEFMDSMLGRELQIALPMKGNQKKLKVKLPQGIEDGQTIRLKGQGEKGMAGGPAGDLLLEIRVKKDLIYEREGLNLIKEERITIGQAYNGAAIPVDTPWGQVKLSIPPGTQGGQKLRLKGKGVKKEGQEGDLHIKISIRIPEKKNDRLSEAIKEIESQYD